MTATRQWRAEADGPSGPGAGAVLDLDHLRIYTMDSPELERELLGIFQVQMGEHLAGLRQAQTAEAWKFAAHTLKGAARALGAQRVADAADALEQLGYGARAEDKVHLLSRLEDEIAACDRFVRDLMG